MQKKEPELQQSDLDSEITSEINFLQEKIKERPVNRKKLARRTAITVVMAMVFGLVACVTFLLLDPSYLPVLQILSSEKKDIYEYAKNSGESKVNLVDLAQGTITNNDIQGINVIKGNEQMLQLSNPSGIALAIRNFLSGYYDFDNLSNNSNANETNINTNTVSENNTNVVNNNSVVNNNTTTNNIVTNTTVNNTSTNTSKDFIEVELD